MKSNQFNLYEFKQGKVAYNKLGNPVKFKCFDNQHPGVMVVQVQPRIGSLNTGSYIFAKFDKLYTNGKKYKGTDSYYDLVSM